MRFPPRTLDEALAHVSEEASEVIKEASKAIRFGLESRDPNDKFNRMNIELMRVEFQDLKDAMDRLEEMYKCAPGSPLIKPHPGTAYGH